MRGVCITAGAARAPSHLSAAATSATSLPPPDDDALAAAKALFSDGASINLPRGRGQLSRRCARRWAPRIERPIVLMCPQSSYIYSQKWQKLAKKAL